MENNKIKLSKKQLIIIAVCLAVGIIVMIVLFVGKASPSSDERPESTEEDPSVEAAKKQIELGNTEREKWPIIKKLPIKNSLFALGYIVEDENFTISISASRTYIDQAIEKLKTLDSDVGQYNVNIKNFSNPFDVELIDSISSDPQEFLRQTFGNIQEDFSIKIGERSGDYYYMVLTTGESYMYNVVTYRTILKINNNSTWEMIASPTPIITMQNAPDVPTDLRIMVNKLD